MAEDRAQARRYGMEGAERFSTALNLPVKPSAHSVSGAKPQRRVVRLDATQLERLKQAAFSHDSSLPTLLVTAFGLVLTRWGGSQHFVIALFGADQARDSIDSRCAEPCALEMDFREAKDLAGACREQSRALQDSAKHNAFRGREVLEATQVAVAPSTAAFRDGATTPPLWIEVLETAGGLEIGWNSAADLLYPGVLDSMCSAFEGLLDFAFHASNWKAALPDLLPEHERRSRSQVNETAAPMPRGLLHTGFLAQSDRSPGRVALCWGSSHQWTYRELLLRVQGIALLLRERGCGPGDRVAITMAKGPLQIAAVLAASACGAAYVPVGVEQPDSRRERIYRSADVAVVLMDEGSHHAARYQLEWPCVLIGDHVQSTRPLPSVAISPTALAYIIYTSGSTGEPKGVEISHQAALNTIEDINHRFAVTQQDRVLAVSALDFDLSVYDIFGLLGVGGSLVLPHEHERRNPYAWQQLLLTWQVTLWNSVPALLDMVLTSREADVSTLRLVMLSGDWIALDLPERLRERNSNCRFVSLGGATEASIWSNWYEVDRVEEDWLSIPYGYPLANQQFRVVDAQGRDCPDWVAGELWIGGAGVALGYRGDEQRTARQFVTWQGQRWYRTGDQGRYWPGGRLEFLGRADHQVKIRGHRIELGEVESALRQHPEVADAVALAVGGRQPYLAAVVAGDQVSAQEVRAFVARLLPAYAIPEQLEVVEQIPLTANGKIDRKTLLQHCKAQYRRAHDPSETDENSEIPKGPEEELIAELWSELLGRDSVGRSAHFMSLGGDRAVATRFVEKVHERGYAKVRVEDVLKCPVLKHLAQVLRIKHLAGRGKNARAPLS